MLDSVLFKIFPAALFAVLVAVDLLSIMFPAVASAGIYAWFTAWFLVAALAGWSLLKLVRHRNIASLLLLAIYLAVFLQTSCDLRNVSHESTQQLSCVMEKLNRFPYYGYNYPCFLGYPTRQYYVPVIPTLLFGSSHAALSSGYFIYPLLGLILFVTGVSAVFRFSLRGDLAGAFLLALLPQVHYFNYLWLNYEQSIFPWSFAAICAGIFLLFFTYRKIGLLLLSGIAVYLSIFSYTPSLVLLPYAAFLLILVVCGKFRPGEKWLSVLLLITWSAGFIRSLGMREDLKLLGKHKSLDHYGAKLAELIPIMHWEEEIFVTAFLKGLLAIALVSALFAAIWQLILRQRLISAESNAESPALKLREKSLVPAWLVLATFVWAAAVVVISVLSSGYANPPPGFAIHRATIVFPVLFAALAFWLASQEHRQVWQMVVLALLLPVALTISLRKNFDMQQQKSVDLKAALLVALESELKSPPAGNIKIYINDNAYDAFANLHDYAVYFAPRLEYQRLESCEQIHNGGPGVYQLVNEHTKPCQLHAELIHVFSDGNQLRSRFRLYRQQAD